MMWYTANVVVRDNRNLQGGHYGKK